MRLLLALSLLVAASCGGSGSTPSNGPDAGIDDGGPIGAPPAAPIHGWILLNADPTSIQRSIEAAAHYGVNHIQLSHDLMMNVDEVLTDDAQAAQRVALLEQAAQMADGYGIETYVWTHEMSEVPIDVCFGPDSDVWRQRSDAYRRALSLLPHVDGTVMMFGSAPVPVWGMLCTCEWCGTTYPETSSFLAPPVDTRIRLVTEHVGGTVANALGKGLIMRTFVHTAQENAWHADGLAAARGVEFLGMHKSEVQDWQPYNPPDPTMGMPERRYGLMELDVAGEYYGLSELPFCSPGYFRYRLRHAWDNLGVGVAVRIERGGHTALDTPNEVNLRAIAELVDNHDASLTTVWNGFIGEHYWLAANSPDSRKLRGILSDTFPVRLKSHYVLGIWAFEKGSDLPASAKLDQFNDRGKMPTWDPDWQPVWDALDAPDLATVRWVAQEGHEAVQIAERSLARIEELQPSLDADDYADLHRRMQHQLHAARAWRSAKLLTFADRAQSRGGVTDPRLDAWKAWAHQELIQTANAMDSEGLADVAIASPSRIRTLVAATENLIDPSATPTEPEPVFSAIETIDVSGTEATLRFQSTAMTVDVDYGRELPDFGQTLQVEVQPAGDTTVVLDGLSPGERYVVRLRGTVDGETHQSGYHWVFTD